MLLSEITEVASLAIKAFEFYRAFEVTGTYKAFVDDLITKLDEIEQFKRQHARYLATSEDVLFDDEIAGARKAIKGATEAFPRTCAGETGIKARSEVFLAKDKIQFNLVPVVVACICLNGRYVSLASRVNDAELKKQTMRIVDYKSQAFINKCASVGIQVTGKGYRDPDTMKLLEKMSEKGTIEVTEQQTAAPSGEVGRNASSQAEAQTPLEEAEDLRASEKCPSK